MGEIMTDQLRKPTEVAQSEQRSSLKLSDEQQQKLNQEFKDPMPKYGSQSSELALMQNAVMR